MEIRLKLSVLLLVALCLVAATSGRRRRQQGAAAYGTNGGYTSGYSSGSSYAQQSSYSHQSGGDFGQVSQTSGQLQADSTEDNQQEELIDEGDDDAIKFGGDISTESRRTKWRTESSDLQGLGTGSGNSYGKQEGWSSQSSWSSQSQAQGQQATAVDDSEVDSLLQGLATTNPGGNLTKTGSLGPGHTYTYQRKVYNYTSGAGAGGTGKPYACRSSTCDSTYRYSQGGRGYQQGVAYGSQSGSVSQGTVQQGVVQQGSSGYVQQGSLQQSTLQQGSYGQSTGHRVVTVDQDSQQGSVTLDYTDTRPTRPPRQPGYHQQQQTLHSQQSQTSYQQREREQPTYQPATSPRPSRQEAGRAEVTCSNGVLKGQLITTSLGKEVYVFLGIPYAKPPVGNRRFRRPEPIDSWDEPIVARNFKPACLQNNITMFPDNTGEAQWNAASVSEDCLYLNIWVPASIFRSKDVQLTDVLVWIYGGGFFSGSSTLDIYNGATLATEKDLIVVSFDYRVGPLGFLFLNTNDAPGNAGMLDQVEALKWINRNIQYFGGNRDAVTLMGESAGSASVSMHLVSPLSRGLFNRAVLLSGLLTSPFATKTPKEAERVSLELAGLVGCDNTRDKSEIAQCLRNLDGMEITQQQFAVSKFLDFAFVPTTDGYFFPSCPQSLLDKSTTKRADILIGTTRDEGSYFLIYQYQRMLGTRSNPSITYDQFLEMMGNFDRIHTVAAAEAITNYYTNWKNPSDGQVNLQRASDAVGDAYFICPSREFSDLWARRGLNVYQYRFSQRTSTNPWPEWMGVMHGDEIEYFFGVPLRESERFTLEEKQLSVHMMNLLANFVKTGVPSSRWQKYTELRPTYVDLNADRITDEVSPTFGPRANECAFWTKILPSVQGPASCTRRNEIDTSVIERLISNVCQQQSSDGSSSRRTGGTNRTSNANATKRSRLSSLHSDCQQC